MTVKFTAALPAVLLALAASPALAALGGSYASVASDRAHFAARVASASAATHTVHTLTLPNGGLTANTVPIPGGGSIDLQKMPVHRSASSTRFSIYPFIHPHDWYLLLS